jgi:hypothetical protein
MNIGPAGGLADGPTVDALLQGIHLAGQAAHDCLQRQIALDSQLFLSVDEWRVS